MKKLFVILAAIGVLGTTSVYAQEQAAAETQTEVVADSTAVEEVAATDVDPAVDVEGEAMHQILKEKVIEGDAFWMAPCLLCLVLGLAIAIERILYLNLATTNTKKTSRKS